ncbi:MAG: putative sulfate exporter family transporter [Pseudomonadota bacterium]|nr:putative sulfate exporter family transporter [Pseudomonadota bacterium]
MSLGAAAWRLIPGLALCLAITEVSMLAQGFEAGLLGRAWLEALVIAILLGTAIRTAWTPGPRWRPGIAFAAKPLLEVAVVLLGATISAATILSAGPALLAAIAAVVALGLTMSYGLGRLFRLPRRMATLIACGNSICGNSAIAAVAPVIGAQARDVAASIAFTAVLGVVVVLLLPVLSVLLHMTPRSFGVFAGLTVYAVPQVLAATAPISSLSAQVGTIVKLVRVLMLGPVVLALSLVMRRRREATGVCGPDDAGDRSGIRLPALHQLVPWFIAGFIALVAARSAGLIPAFVVAPTAKAATWLTIVAMAALGLGVDVRVVARAGARVTAVVSLSLVALGAAALIVIHGLGLR